MKIQQNSNNNKKRANGHRKQEQQAGEGNGEEYLVRGSNATQEERVTALEFLTCYINNW